VWTVAADAPNADLAIEWINFMNEPEFYLEWDSIAGAPVPANLETFNQLPEDSFTRQVFGDPEVVERLVFQSYIPNETREELQFMWQEVKAFGGQ
jgi:spermidine/putrescine transport system substrate-binding protein